MDQLPRLGKRELICLLLFTCNYVVFVWRGFLFLWVLGMGNVILLWHSLSLPYNYFEYGYPHSNVLFNIYTSKTGICFKNNSCMGDVYPLRLHQGSASRSNINGPRQGNTPRGNYINGPQPGFGEKQVQEPIPKEDNLRPNFAISAQKTDMKLVNVGLMESNTDSVESAENR